jgi:hypothetical protein
MGVGVGEEDCGAAFGGPGAVGSAVGGTAVGGVVGTRVGNDNVGRGEGCSNGVSASAETAGGPARRTRKSTAPITKSVYTVICVLDIFPALPVLVLIRI